MSANDNISDKNARSYQLAFVIIAMIVTVPAFLIGSEILIALGLYKGILAIISGFVIVACLAALTMSLGAKSFSSTIELSEASFGRSGAKLISAIIGVSLVGWFAVTAKLLGVEASSAFQQASRDFTQPLIVIIGSILVSICVIRGFKIIKHIGAVLTPMMFLVLIIGVFLVADILFSGNHDTLAEPAKTSLGISTIFDAITIIIGSFAVSIVVIGPDIGRFSRTKSSASIGAFLGFGLGGTLVLILAGLPALALSSTSLSENYSILGIGVLATILIPLAVWTTNINNLYSANIAVSHALKGQHPVMVCIFLCAIGTIAALTMDMSLFANFLTILSIAIPPIAGVYLCDGYVLNRISTNTNTKKVDFPSFIAWGLGVLGGGIAHFMEHPIVIPPKNNRSLK